MAGSGRVRSSCRRAWVEESTRSQVQPDDASGTGYGYQWWLRDVPGQPGDAHPAFAAMGYAGQLIAVVPDLKLVVAVSCLDGPARSRPLTWPS